MPRFVVAAGVRNALGGGGRHDGLVARGHGAVHVPDSGALRAAAVQGTARVSALAIRLDEITKVFIETYPAIAAAAAMAGLTRWVRPPWP